MRSRQPYRVAENTSLSKPKGLIHQREAHTENDFDARSTVLHHDDERNPSMNSGNERISITREILLFAPLCEL